MRSAPKFFLTLSILLAGCSSDSRVAELCRRSYTLGCASETKQTEADLKRCLDKGYEFKKELTE